MNCEHCQTLFFDYERKTLTPKAEQELTAHLQGCAHCATTLANLQQVNQLLDLQHAPSPGAEARFRERLQREAQAGVQRQAALAATSSSLFGTLQHLWRKYWPAQPLGGFSYSVALLLLGLVGGQSLPPRSFGFGAEASQLSEQPFSRERLIQLCAVPPLPTASAF